MKITRVQVVTGIIIVIASLFLIGVLFNIEMLANYSRAIVLPFFVLLYYLKSETKSKFFAGFLVAYALAELSKIPRHFDYNLFSQVANISYIIAYICLMIYIMQGINLRKLIGKFKLYLVVLLLFNIYIIVTLNQMIAADDLLNIYTVSFFIECIYNICMLLVLSFAMLNYLYHDSKRGLLLFLACAAIVFSEMVQVAYIFVSADYILNVIYSLLFALGFGFIYFYIISSVNKYYNVLA